MKNISLISYSCGAGAAKNTCADGPAYLKKYGLAEQLASIGLSAKWLPDLDSPSKKNEQDIAIVAKYCSHVKQQVQDVLRADGFPVVIGGDHSMAIGTWAGVADALSTRRKLGLIWIDAHMDAHTATSSPTGNVHGMPISYLLGCGDDAITHITGKNPVIDPNHLCLIGIRSFEAEEKALLDKMGAKVFSMAEVTQKGLDAVMTEAVAIASNGTAGFGLSIDVDAFDPEIAPGTGTLAKNGLLQDKFTHAIQLALKGHRKNLLALEIAEYNPHLDEGNITADLVADIVATVLQ